MKNQLKSNRDNSLPVLPQVTINTPCPKIWDEMDGDLAKRFCGHCQKHVYNFSELDTKSVDQLLSSGQSICARIIRNPDGSIVTKDCSPEKKDNDQISRRGWFHRLTAMAASLATLLIFGGCSDPTTPSVTGELAPVPQATPTATMGGAQAFELGDVALTEDAPEALVGKIRLPDPQNPPIE